jgi:hypothetical protein
MCLDVWLSLTIFYVSLSFASKPYYINLHVSFFIATHISVEMLDTACITNKDIIGFVSDVPLVTLLQGSTFMAMLISCWFCIHFYDYANC